MPTLQSYIDARLRLLLAYALRYAHETAGEDGGRRIVIATDRPIGFWEASRDGRTLDYPFTVIQVRRPLEEAR